MKITKISSSCPLLLIRLFLNFFLGTILLLSQISVSFANQPQKQSLRAEGSSQPEHGSENTTTTDIDLEAAKQGPAKIELIDQGLLEIPNNSVFIPKNEAESMMRAIGNKVDSGFIGLIMPTEEKSDWFISIGYTKSGYMSEDEATTLDAKDLLRVIQENTEKDNKRRTAQGIAPLNIIGWIETPKYKASTHELTWSLLAESDDNPEKTVNYKTMLLGREGYFNFLLVTKNSLIEKDKVHFKNILSTVRYNRGKRYEDFAEGTDRVAEYGLAALITGVAAKKLGLLGIIGILIAKIWKFLILIPIIFWGKIKSLFTKKT